MALGARPGEIFRIFVRESLKLSLAGLAIGLVVAFALGRAGRSLLFGVTASDPLAFIGGLLLLVAVTTMACYFPAWRATKVDAVEALRQE